MLVKILRLGTKYGHASIFLLGIQLSCFATQPNERITACSWLYQWSAIILTYRYNIKICSNCRKRDVSQELIRILRVTKLCYGILSQVLIAPFFKVSQSNPIVVDGSKK